MAHSQQKKEQAIRLRVKEGKSLKVISEEVGISKGTASLWLRDYPLSDSSLKERFKLGGFRGGRPKVDRKPIGWSLRYPSNTMSSHQKAKLAEAAVLFRLTVVGCDVFGSPFDGDTADWIVKASGKLAIIQVKWAEYNGRGMPTVSLRHSSGRRKTGRTSRYQKGDFDFIVGYDYYSDKCYVWSWKEVEHLNTAVSCLEDAEERWDKLE